MRLLFVGGSTRAGSTNSAALHAALELVPDEVETELHERLAELPHFNPDARPRSAAAGVVELRAAIERADAVVFCTPEYAGTLPGSFKNLLDWTVGGAEMYGKPRRVDQRRGRGARGRARRDAADGARLRRRPDPPGQWDARDGAPRRARRRGAGATCAGLGSDRHRGRPGRSLTGLVSVRRGPHNAGPCVCASEPRCSSCWRCQSPLRMPRRRFSRGDMVTGTRRSARWCRRGRRAAMPR